MPGSLKVTFIAALAGLGAVSAQETTTRVPDKSVDFCDTVSKYHVSKFYSDCSGLATTATAAPAVEAEPPARRAPTGLPKFPYHSVSGARETATPGARAVLGGDEHRGPHHGHHSDSALPSFPHAKPTGIPHARPTNIVAREVDAAERVGRHHGGAWPGLPPHLRPTPTGGDAQDSEPTDIVAREVDAAELVGRHHGGAWPGLPPHLRPTPTGADVVAREVDAAERVGRHHGGAWPGMPPHLRPSPTNGEVPHHKPTDIVARAEDEAERHGRHHGGAIPSFPHQRPTGTWVPHDKPTGLPSGSQTGEEADLTPRAAAGPGEDHPTIIDDGDEIIDESIPRAHPTTIKGGPWEKPTGFPFVKPTALPLPLPTVLPSGFLTIAKD